MLQQYISCQLLELGKEATRGVAEHHWEHSELAHGHELELKQSAAHDPGH